MYKDTDWEKYLPQRKAAYEQVRPCEECQKLNKEIQTAKPSSRLRTENSSLYKKKEKLYEKLITKRNLHHVSDCSTKKIFKGTNGKVFRLTKWAKQIIEHTRLNTTSQTNFSESDLNEIKRRMDEKCGKYFNNMSFCTDFLQLDNDGNSLLTGWLFDSVCRPSPASLKKFSNMLEK